MKTLFFLLLPVTVWAQNPEIVITHLRDSANTVQFEIVVQRDQMPHGPWVTIGTNTYQDWVQSMWGKNDSVFRAKMTFIYLLDSVNEPILIKAKDFTSQGGTTTDSGGNLGVEIENGATVGFINPGDWIHYSNVLLSGKTRIKVLYSLVSGTDMVIEVRRDGITGPVLASMPIQPTGSWTTWLEKTADITPVPESVQLYLTFRGSGYVCNLDTIVFE